MITNFKIYEKIKYSITIFLERHTKLPHSFRLNFCNENTQNMSTKEILSVIKFNLSQSPLPIISPSLLHIPHPLTHIV